MTTRPSSKDLLTVGNTDMGPLIDAFENLPKNLYNRHLGAAMKSALRKAKAVQILKQVTEESVPGLNPKGIFTTKLGRVRKDGTRKVSFKQSLIRSQSNFLKQIRIYISKRRWEGNKKGARPLIARVGWTYGIESKKAIWLESGTRTGGPAFLFVQRAMIRIRPRFNEKVADELLHGIEAAAKVMAANVWKKTGGRYDYSTYRRKRRSS